MSMFVVICVLLVLICIVLILAVLIQNPKGGGLSASFGGIGNQVLGARRSTEIIEKITWGLAVALLAFSLLSAVVMPKSGSSGTERVEDPVDIMLKENATQTITNDRQQPALPENPQ